MQKSYFHVLNNRIGSTLEFWVLSVFLLQVFCVCDVG